MNELNVQSTSLYIIRSYIIFILDSEVGMKKTTTPQLIPQWNDENAIIHENVLSKANANANNVVGSGQYYYV